MKQPFFGRSDGRLQKGLRAIKKLHALGLTRPQDIIELVQSYREFEQRHVDAGRDGADRATRERRLRWSVWAVRWMMALGFSESEIAFHTKVDHSTIAHLLDPSACRPISLAAARRLLRAVRTIGAERLKMLLPRVAIRVLDTCNHKGHIVDGSTHAALAEWARHAISHALLATSAPVPVVAGVSAFLAEVGDPAHRVFLVGAPLSKTDAPDVQLEQLRRLEHEVDHLRRRIRQERRRIETIRRPARLLSDGHIA